MIRRFGLGVGVMAIDKVAVTLVQLLMIPILVNAWGLTLFGIWAMISTVPMLLAMGDFGIVTASWSRLTMFLSRGEPDAARATLHTAWLALVSICLGIALLAAVVVLWLPDGIVPVTAGFGEVEARAAILLLVAYGLASIVFQLLVVVIRAGGRFPLAIACSTGNYALAHFALLLSVLLGADPLWAAAVFLAATLVALAAVAILCTRLFPALRLGFAAARRSEWAELWRPGFQALVLAAGFLVFIQASVIVLGAVAGAAAVPAFVAVRTISRIGLQFTQLIAQPASQEFGRSMARGESYRAGRFFGLVAGASLAMGLAMAVGMILLAVPAVRVWTGGAIEAPFSLVVLMAISSFAVILWNPVALLMLSVSRQKAVAYASLPISLIGLGLIAMTAESLRATSAAMAFAVVDGAMLIAAIVFVRRNWLRDGEFRRGVGGSLGAVMSPLATWRALRGGES